MARGTMDHSMAAHRNILPLPELSEWTLPRTTNTKNFETDFKVSSQSRKFEFNVFSILHLNGHNV